MKIKLVLAIVLFSTFKINAQVGIGTTSPDNNSILDVESTNKGILIPRLQLNNVNTPAPLSAPITNGMLIYSNNGNELDGFYFWRNSKWVSVSKGLKKTYTPNSVGSGNLPSNTDKFVTFDGNWVNLLVLPNAASSNDSNRLNELITIQKRSTYNVNISNANTDMSTNLTLTGNKQSAFFIFDGTKWVHIKTSN